MTTLLNVSLPLWVVIVVPIVLVLGMFIAGFFVARTVFKKYLEKNPPINEDMVRAMMQQMGRTPSEKQVRAVMREMEANQKGKSK